MGIDAMPSFRVQDAVPPSGSAPRFLIHDPERAWMIETGAVDLFLVRVEAGEPVGARHHVMRVQAGNAIFGLEATEGACQLLACPNPETHIVEARQDRLREMAMSAESAGAAELIENWIRSVAAAASPQVPPKTFEVLQPDKESRTGKESRALFPSEGVLWVKHVEGESYFLGDSELPVRGDGYFPVSAGGWLEGQPKTRVASSITREMLVSDPGCEGLRVFHRLVLLTLTRNLRRTEEAQQQRLLRKAKADEARLDAALRRLSSPLRRRRELAPPCETEGDQVLAACQLVGNHLRVEIKRHADQSADVAGAIEGIARASDLRVRRVILSGEWWRRDNGPLVAFWEQGGRAVALIPASPGRYSLYDPGERQISRVSIDVTSKVGPFGYTFYRPFPEKRLTVGALLRFGLQGCGRDLTTIVAMGMAMGLVGAAVPIATGIIFDSLIPGAERGQLLQMSIFLFAITICSLLFQLTRSLAVLRLEGKLDATIQAAVWDRLLSLPVHFFRDFSSGDLASRGMGMDQIRQTLTGPVLTSIISGVFTLFNFLLLFYYSWRLALVATALIGVAFAVATLCGYPQVHLQRDISRLRGQLAGLVLGLIGGIAKLRVSGAESRAFAVWAREFAAQKIEAVRARRVSNALAVFNSAFPVLCTVAIFYVMGEFADGQSAGGEPPVMTTGSFLAFFVAFGQLLAAVLMLSSAIVSVVGIVPVYERAKPILDALPEVDQAKTNPGELSGSIDIKHVSFRYRPDTPLVLKDLSLTIRPGEFVAVVGSSGSGKSTLFRLLLGFERPESGSIYYDGQDMVGLDIRAVRRQIGVVLQNSKLVTATVMQNIVGSAPLTVEQAWEAARLCGFDQDIRAMPMGMHTIISEGGGGLSGGQRQRLMIARAIVNKPRILLFDEATSALDNETQAIVSRSLEKLKATRIVIAHRLSTIVNADRIFVLDKGSVAESGSYSELMATGGLFAELAKRQLV